MFYCDFLTHGACFLCRPQTVEHGFPHQPSALSYSPSLELLAIGTRSGAIKLYPLWLFCRNNYKWRIWALMNAKSLSVVNVGTFSDNFSRSYSMLSHTAHTVFSVTIVLAQLCAQWKSCGAGWYRDALGLMSMVPSFIIHCGRFLKIWQ